MQIHVHVPDMLGGKIGVHQTLPIVRIAQAAEGSSARVDIVVEVCFRRDGDCGVPIQHVPQQSRAAPRCAHDKDRRVQLGFTGARRGLPRGLFLLPWADQVTSIQGTLASAPCEEDRDPAQAAGRVE